MSCCAAQLDISICRGATFSLPLRIEVSPLVYKPITSIANSAPARLVVPAHGLPDGWRVALVGVQGPTRLNSKNWPPKPKDFYKATVIDANTIELNTVVTLDDTVHVASTGSLVYYTPADLAAFTDAMMQIKSDYGGDIIESLFMSTGEIVIDLIDNRIFLTIPDTRTSLMSLEGGVYDLEFVSGATVTRLLGGNVKVCDEVTTVASVLP